MRLRSSKSARPAFEPVSVFSITIALKVAMAIRTIDDGLRTTDSSSRRRCQSRHRPLDNRQIDRRREQAEQDREPPDRVVGSGALEQHAARQQAKKPHNLMPEEGKPNSLGAPPVPNKTENKADVGGTVDSHSRPMTAPKTRVATVLGGSRM